MLPMGSIEEERHSEIDEEQILEKEMIKSNQSIICDSFCSPETFLMGQDSGICKNQNHKNYNLAPEFKDDPSEIDSPIDHPWS